MNVYYSNKVEKLFEGLKCELFHPNTTPFTKRYVIVPSPAMKNWLTAAMAEDADLGIAAGIHVTYIESATQEIIAALSDHPEQFPKKISEFELAIKLEIEIKKIMETYPKMETHEQVVWEPLLKYLLSVKSIPKYYALTKKETARILTLSVKLANLFITYGKYGSKMLQKWKRDLSLAGEWQKELWKRSVDEVYPQCHQWRTKNTTVHLFGLSFISMQQHQLFISLSKVIPVHYYLLSPCLLFWSELLSDRECTRLIKFWEKKGVEETQQLALEEYIYDRNPLLANLGRLGREMALQIENSDCITQEQYAVAGNLKEIEAYRDLFSDAIDFSTSKTSPSLLECLQADFLMMRKPSQNDIIELYNDQSIQLLMSSSLMREVQTLYDVLLHIIDKHSKSIEPLLPEDIIVMAPDIIKYEPYIHAVFSELEAKLDYQMMDLNLVLRHPLVQGFFSFIELAESRWDVSSLLKLFDNRLFQQRHRFSAEDMQKIKSWIEAADVRWGVDSEHRIELLKKEFDPCCKMDQAFSGTWKRGVERLLLGMVMVLPEGDDAADKTPISPLNIIDTSQVSLFSDWMCLMQSLKDDLRPLTDTVFLSMGEWSVYLKRLIESYFLQPKENEHFDEETQNFLDCVSSLALNKKYEKERFSFSTVKYHLEQNLNKQRIGYRESHLHAVRFCSMLPMRALPAKVVVLLGMSEDSYPRREPNDSLNALKKESGCDYYPTQPEFDRYLFLETILSARQYYILSYCGYSKEEGKSQSASLLISELFSYLDGGFRVDGKKPSEVCFKKTPFLSYDKSLFEEGGEVRSYAAMHYRAAKIYYEKNAQPSHCFVPEFKRLETSALEIVEKLDLRHLSQMAKNPIEAYLKHKLGMYLKFQEPRKNKNEEDFTLDAMQNAILRNGSLKRSLDAILHSAEREGKLPFGPFKNFSIGKLRTEVEAIKQNFFSLQVDIDSIFEIRFSDHHENVNMTETGDWEVPPLQCFCNGKNVKLVGTLSHISPSGMIVLSGDDKADVLKIWPHYLVFLCALKQFELTFENRLFFAKSKKSREPFFDNPFPYLEKYLCYYHHSLENISPLIPEWTFDILQESKEKFSEKMESTLSDRNPYFYNSYFKWILRGSKNPDTQVMMDNWKIIAEEQFEELFHHWYPSKKGEKILK